MLTVTCANVAEVLDLRWQEIWELSEDGGSERLCDFRSRPHSLRLEPEETARVFREDFTTERLYKFWVRTRAEVGPHSVRLHNARHSYASQGVMNGVGLTAVASSSVAATAPPPQPTPPRLCGLCPTARRRGTS